MDIRESIFKVKSKDGPRWVYRLRYKIGNRPVEERHLKDANGVLFPQNARGEHKARTAARARIKVIEASQGNIAASDRMTFNDLVKICVDVPGGKYYDIASKSSILAYTKSLKAFFGKMLIREITRDNLRTYKAKRLAEFVKVKPGDPKRNVSHSTVHRELATMRAMMYHALAEGWLVFNPFFKSGLIKVNEKTEPPRKRVLSFEEEERLLAACSGEWEVTYQRRRKGKAEEVTRKVEINNQHLRAMIILAIDSGMRRGEILKMKWRDIHFDDQYIEIRAENTKTGSGRIAALSARAIEAIRALPREGDRPFPYTDIKRSFATAKRLAGVDDLHFHDLRSTYNQRLLIDGKVSTGLVSKSLGHSSISTTLRHYTAADIEAARLIAERVDAMQRTASIGKALDVVESEARELLN